MAYTGFCFIKMMSSPGDCEQKLRKSASSFEGYF